MALAPGTHLGVYEVTAQIGEGGMGQVFRATDTKLKRQVALKILPPAVAGDHDRLARFHREAEVLASVNHPNIAGIYGVEERPSPGSGQAGTTALVMELVEGEDLSAIIARGPIPIADALPLAKQLADALEAAHDKGIVHRDLKPANIKITPQGQLKVLDFGLARALDTKVSTATADLSNSPTMTTPPATAMGVVLGTAAYMSPEQAKGKPTDRTTDMWAFGCVVFEMITGRAAFEGESAGEILGSIFKTEPDWTLLPADTPASIRRLLRRCLQKDRTLRLRDAGDARLEIAEAPDDAAPAMATSPTTRRRQLAWAGALTALGLIVGALGALQLRRAPVASELWFDIAMPATPPASRFSVSPDGKRVVFRGERQQLWIRSFESATATPVAGTNNGTFPFWSADSQSIGFFAEGKLRRIAAEGGQARDLSGASLPRGGSWNRDNVILFAPTLGSPIMRMSASGGEATPVTTMGPEDSGHLAPQFLPDGRHFLYYVISRADASGVYISDLTSAETRQVLKTESAAVYGSSALFYARQSELVAQPFDADRLVTTGAPQILGPVVMGPSDIPSVSVADGGPIVFRAPSDRSQGDSGGSVQFVWLDRAGKEVARVADAPPGFGRSAELSPDGNHVAYTRVVSAGEADIWLLEISRGVFSRFTLEKGDDVTPVWSPDGGRIVFGRREKGVINLYEKPLVGAAGSERLLLSSDQDKSATDWSRDGKYLLYSSIDPKTNSDIWAMRMGGDRPAAGSPRPVLQTAFQEGGARMSADGQWMAYQSNKSGRPEIYVQPFPGPGADVPVSTTGGTSPRWRRDGKEIYYLAPDNRLMAVSIRATPTGSPLQLAAPVPLFQSTNDEYMVSPDGQRFLKYSATAASSTSPLSVIVNWKPGKN